MFEFTDTKAEGVEYLRRRREIIPGVYNPLLSEGRTTAQTRLLTGREYNIALNTGLNAMSNRFMVKQEVFIDEISELRKRCADAVDAIDGLDDSDIEFLREVVDESDNDSDFEALINQPETVQAENPIDNSNDLNATEEDFVTANSSQEIVEANDAQINQIHDQPTDNVSSTNVQQAQLKSLDGSEQRNATIQNADDDNIDISALSGEINVHQTEVKDLIYPVYDSSIRFPIAKMLITWNKTYPFNTRIYDKRFIGVLYRDIVGIQPEENVLKGIEFMKRLFEIRVQNDETRNNDFDDIFDDIHEKQKQKKETK